MIAVLVEFASRVQLGEQDAVRHVVAWHILLAIHGMLDQEARDRFVDCAYSILEPELEAVGSQPARERKQ